MWPCRWRATPRDVLDCLVRFGRVASSSVQLTIEREGGASRLLYHSTNNRRVTVESMDAFFASMLGNARRVFMDIGGFYYCARVMRVEPANAELYRKVFGVDVEFGASEYSLLFDESLLDAPLATSNPEMYRWCEKMLAEYLGRLDMEDIEERVRQVVVELLPKGEVGRAMVASRLNLSERSLCRRLSEKGVGFQCVLDAVRHEGARSLLACKDINQVDIAEQLGFSDTSSFIPNLQALDRPDTGAI